ncbi:MAG TPA: HlyD family efflux transporter periplasmic adaptor subunit [Polyangia bacterium]|nr:HlyD family efflux transporter periplasmic adaptor subunit [Polyangia bacterium]
MARVGPPGEKWKKWKKRLVWGGVLLVVLVVVAWSLRPVPLRVESAPIVRGPLRVTVSGEGKTRVRERYQVLAPLGGRMARITLRPGDRVDKDAVVTVIDPVEPPLLDVRTRAEAEARVRAAEASLVRATAAVEVARVAVETAETEAARYRLLVSRGAAARAQLDVTESELKRRVGELAASRAAAEADRYQLETARASLLGFQGSRTAQGVGRVPVRAPVSGSVLRVLREDAGVVSAGTPLIEFGDIQSLEVVVDLLSTQAVQVELGDEAILDQWGGGRPLTGRVRRIEPSGFTKVSALGVEEQRVNVVIDLGPGPEGDPPGAGGERSATPALGDGFQVETHVVVWQADKVLKVPVGALFREGDRWQVYVAEAGRAHRRTITIGHRSDTEAEVLSGLREGDRVILHPGDKLGEGSRVAME